MLALYTLVIARRHDAAISCLVVMRDKITTFRPQLMQFAKENSKIPIIGYLLKLTILLYLPQSMFLRLFVLSRE